MTIVNLTPHTIVIVSGNGNKIEIAPTGIIPRVSTTVVKVGEEGGIPLFRTEYGAVTDLPPSEDGKLFVVSGLLKAACPERKDLLTPAKQIRDEAGRVVGCEGLSF